MKKSAQNRAVEKYRDRLQKSGLARFEVIGLKTDQQLLRSIARRLAKKDQEAANLRSTIAAKIDNRAPSQKGEVLAWLRNSPLAGEELNIDRSKNAGRKVEL